MVPEKSAKHVSDTRLGAAVPRHHHPRRRWQGRNKRFANLAAVSHVELDSLFAFDATKKLDNNQSALVVGLFQCTLQVDSFVAVEITHIVVHVGHPKRPLKQRVKVGRENNRHLPIPLQPLDQIDKVYLGLRRRSIPAQTPEVLLAIGVGFRKPRHVVFIVELLVPGEKIFAIGLPHVVDNVPGQGDGRTRATSAEEEHDILLLLYRLLHLPPKLSQVDTNRPAHGADTNRVTLEVGLLGHALRPLPHCIYTPGCPNSGASLRPRRRWPKLFVHMWMRL
mmetsp:Transcript_21750/g.56697  ORF Transcript_21750/g.56697 Transcript_21750/m.56697 type:complete len:279 (-) Transcript_21750:223-1059(-)